MSMNSEIVTKKWQGLYAIVLLYLLLLIGLYQSAYSWLIGVDWNYDDYNYCYLIPLIVGYLIWEHKDELAAQKSLFSWAGLWFIIPGILLYWLGELGGEYFSLYLSSWLVVVGLCWLHIGWQKLKIIAFPLCFSLAMFPPPSFIHHKLSLQLKLISSKLGVLLLQALGMSVYREGNVIDLGFTTLQVVDACNGLRYLIPLIVLGILLAYFYKGPLWQKVIIVGSTIPLSILTNGFRIATVGLLYPVMGKAAAEGFFHDFSGWFIFMVTLAVLLAEMWLLRKLFPAHKQAKDFMPEAPSSQRRIAGTDVPSSFVALLRAPQVLLSLFLLVGTLALSSAVEFREKVPVSRPLTSFPLAFADWQGQSRAMEQKFINELDFSDYTIIDYRNSQQDSINFYVAYYESQRKGESIHSPATCLPGGGWVLQNAGTVSLEINGKTMPVNRAFIQKGDAKQLTYYWFPMRGRILTNAYQLKLYTFWDALTRQRTDGALVRLVTPVSNSEDVADADGRLQDQYAPH